MSEALPTSTPVDLLPESQVPTQPGYDADLYGTDDSWAREQQLQLRPHEFARGGRHPDQRPCPPWCAAARYPEHEHEIEPRNPLVALHVVNGGISTIASKYCGRGWGSDEVESATLYSTMYQRGQGDPEIDVLIRHYGSDGRQVQADIENPALKLSVDDATELVTALTYLLRLTRG